MLSGLAAALCAGLVLAIVLPSAAALSAPWGLRWRALAQVHGHILVVGWVGFFIIGMATRLLPRFSGSPLRFARCIPTAFAFIAMALALRSVAQPLADAGSARALLPVSGGLEMAGIACFALSALTTLKRPLVERRPFAYFLAAGTVWIVVDAMLTTWALTRMAQASEMVVAGADFVKAGKWRTWDPMLLRGRDIHHATLGLVGLGRIGTEMGKRGRGFDMKVIYTSRNRQPDVERELGFDYRELDDLAPGVEVLAPEPGETIEL